LLSQDTPYHKILTEVFKTEVPVMSVRSVPGGCINKVEKVVTHLGNFIIKTNKASLYPGMFEKEAKGLSLLHSAKSITIPEIIGEGICEDQQFLVLSYIEPASKRKNFWENFAISLGNLHSVSNVLFGLEEDNYIGSLEQKNSFQKNWIDFFIMNRLQFQLELAIKKGLVTSSLVNKFESLYKRLPELLPVYTPRLIHGDLWSGNFMVDQTGSAALIDPAVYYGNPEVEIAFTTLFGEFDAVFYETYYQAFPFEKGFQNRIDLYNLYPLLVHLNLFGKNYLQGIENIITKI
jgi:protein-ribulosamine 3-kinase